VTKGEGGETKNCEKGEARLVGRAAGVGGGQQRAMGERRRAPGRYTEETKKGNAFLNEESLIKLTQSYEKRPSK